MYNYIYNMAEIDFRFLYINGIPVSAKPPTLPFMLYFVGVEVRPSLFLGPLSQESKHSFNRYSHEPRENCQK